MTTSTTKWTGIRIAIAGLLMSALGDEIATIALALKLSATHGSMANVAVLMAASMIPGIILPPYTARLLARVPAPIVLEAAIVSQGGIVAAAATARTLPPVLVCVVALGGLGSMALSAMLTIVPTIVPSEKLFSVNRWIEIGQNVGYVGGPGVAATLVAIGGARLALLSDAASFLFEAAAMLPVTAGILRARGKDVQRRGGESRERGGGGHWANARALLSETRRRAVLIPILISIASSSMLNVSLVYYMRSHVIDGDSSYGPVVSALSGGLIIGPLVLAKILRKNDTGYLALGSAIVIGVTMTCTALTTFVGYIGGFLFLFGCANGVQNVSLTTYVMKTIPGDRRTVLTATYVGFLQAAVVIGFIAAGCFQSRWSQQVLVVGGLASGISCLIGILRYTPSISSAIRPQEGEATHDGNEQVRA